MSAAQTKGVAYRIQNNTLVVCLAAVFTTVAGSVLHADDTSELRALVETLRQENSELKGELKEQRELIDGLTRKVSEIQKNAQPQRESSNETEMPAVSAGFNFGKVHISGEGGVAFFDTSDEGAFPNSEFRVDEAKLFVEAPIWDDVYFFSELNLAQREQDDLNLDLGELYLDFEDVSKLWGQERQLNIRAGRIDIPFGEEYMVRDAIDNPLISHSLADFWGVDEGIELYGSAGKFSYVVAVQNGGVPGTRDFNSDKAITARVGFDPNRWLHLSVSAMRTGNLDVNDDFLSELWFGSGWFRSLGSTNTTRFDVQLLQGDVAIRLPHGHIKAFGGIAHYDDNDPSASNRRDIYYYSVEALHRFNRKFYAAARFSEIMADDGFPVVGYGEFHDYFFGDLTKELWRLSLGLGYRFSDQLVLKAEYTHESGKEVGGEQRSENVFAAEAAFKF